MYILVTDTNCPRCSEIGSVVDEHADGVESIGESMAVKRGLIDRPLTEPVLLKIDSAGHVVARYAGGRLRVKVASLLGVRGVGLWPKLAYLESKARDERARSGLTRRTSMIGGLAAGISGIAGVAAAQSSPLRATSVNAVLQKSRTAVAAESMAGAVVSADTGTRRGLTYTALYHGKMDVLTGVTILDSSNPDDPAAIMIRPREDRSAVISLVRSGEQLGTMTPKGEFIPASNPAKQEASAGGVQPMGANEVLGCAHGCIQELKGQCNDLCNQCIAEAVWDPGPGGFIGITCGKCYVCAGAGIFVCVKDCWDKW